MRWRSGGENKSVVWLVRLAVLHLGMAVCLGHAACIDEWVDFKVTKIIYRIEGDKVWTYSRAYAYGPDAPKWAADVGWGFYIGWTLKASGTYTDPSTPWNSVVEIDREPSSWGPGDYGQAADGYFTCDSWYWYEEPVYVGPVYVRTPTICAHPETQECGPGEFWYLGGVEEDNGYWAGTTMVGDPEAPGDDPYWEPETPQWFEETSPVHRLSFSCTQCSETDAWSTSASPSQGQPNYDVKVRISIGGFESDQRTMFINTLKSLDRTSSYTDDQGDAGYKTEIYYKVRDCCGDVSVPISLNEQLGAQSCSQTHPNCNWFADDPHHPEEEPVQVGSWVGNEFADGVGYWRVGTPNPFPNPDPVGPFHPQAGELVSSGNQKWRAGSTQSYDGVLVQNKTLKYYRGRGDVD